MAIAVMVALADILAYPLFNIENVIAPDGFVDGGALYLINVMVTVVPELELEFEVFWSITKLKLDDVYVELNNFIVLVDWEKVIVVPVGKVIKK